MTPTGHLDTDACYRAVRSRDRRFVGRCVEGLNAFGPEPVKIPKPPKSGAAIFATPWPINS